MSEYVSNKSIWKKEEESKQHNLNHNCPSCLDGITSIKNLYCSDSGVRVRCGCVRYEYSSIFQSFSLYLEGLWRIIFLYPCHVSNKCTSRKMRSRATQLMFGTYLDMGMGIWSSKDPLNMWKFWGGKKKTYPYWQHT